MNTTETPNSAPAPQQHNGTSQAHHAHPVATAPQTESDPLPTKPCNAWFDDAKAMPPVTPLFDVFWSKGELAFLFGETGVGKSILAVQIADAISKGSKIACFDGPQEPMRVGYFDFEHSTCQFLRRYSNGSGSIHDFSPNFFRFGINVHAILKCHDILEGIEEEIIKHRIEVAVIDSLTHLPIFITEKTNARSIMRRLHLIKSRQNISMLVVGHSMRQDLSQPITEYDLVCSIFCDSAFAIGESAKEKNVRYLKQIKTGSARLRYDIGYAAVFRLVKRNRFIGFEHIDFDCEYEHL